MPAALDQGFASLEPQVRLLAQKVRGSVAAFCEANGYAFVGRLKTAESLAEKVETGRYADWDALDDIYACAIVIPTMQAEAHCLEALRSAFIEHEIRARGASQKDPAIFRFDATRFIGRLRSDGADDPEALMYRLSFEVQVRTAFEHAWSTTTHALAYKGARIEWRRFRLAAQLKAAVEQLDGLVDGFDQVSARISEHDWPEVMAKRSVEEFMRSRLESGILPSEAEPATWVRFCDNFVAVVKAVQWTPMKDLPSRTEAALRAVEQELATINPSSFPRSLSLMQFCIGALVNQRFVVGPLRDYVPPLSSELLSLYPETTLLGKGFEYTPFANTADA